MLGTEIQEDLIKRNIASLLIASVFDTTGSTPEKGDSQCVAKRLIV